MEYKGIKRPFVAFLSVKCWTPSKNIFNKLITEGQKIKNAKYMNID